MLTSQPIAKLDIDGLVQDCSNSSVLAMELLQSCNKPSNYDIDQLEIDQLKLVNFKALWSEKENNKIHYFDLNVVSDNTI